MDAVKDLLTSPSVVAVVVGGLAALAWRLVNRREAWKAVYDTYKGAIFQAVRWAEKAIDDATEEKWLKRADLALQYAVRFIEALERRELADAEKRQVMQAIEYGHAELSRAGVLPRAAAQTTPGTAAAAPAPTGAS